VHSDQIPQGHEGNTMGLGGGGGGGVWVVGWGLGGVGGGGVWVGGGGGGGGGGGWVVGVAGCPNNERSKQKKQTKSSLQIMRWGHKRSSGSCYGGNSNVN